MRKIARVRNSFFVVGIECQVARMQNEFCRSCPQQWKVERALSRGKGSSFAFVMFLGPFSKFC